MTSTLHRVHQGVAARPGAERKAVRHPFTAEASTPAAPGDGQSLVSRRLGDLAARYV